MLHRCEDCPSYKALEEYVTTKMNELEIDEEIRYSQWESVDRTMLQKHSTPVDDFIELLVYWCTASTISQLIPLLLKSSTIFKIEKRGVR